MFRTFQPSEKSACIQCAPVDFYGKTFYIAKDRVCIRFQVFNRGFVRYARGENNCGPDKFRSGVRYPSLARFSALVGGTKALYVPLPSHGWTGSIDFTVDPTTENVTFGLDTRKATKTFTGHIEVPKCYE